MSNSGMDVDLDDDADEFYFESDHIALKENKDYRLLLKTILNLEVQRTQGIQDIDKIQEIQKTALEDPIAFVEKITKGEDLGIPPPMKIKELPQIDWSKYQHVMPKEISRPFTRTKKSVQTTRPSETTVNAEDSTSDDGSRVLIRGRAFDDSKPETFNQLWTPEEQKRLEELLVEFPLEEVESRRWKKIADALGNRTTKQVQSRVQKYFKKLHSAGLPVPGRIPRMNVDMIRKGHKHQRNNYLLQKPSTFFPALDPPVLMRDETEDDCSFNSNTEESQGPSERPKNIIVSYPESAVPVSNYAELLKMIVKAKNCASSTELQDGYSCDGCGEDPLEGTRWHCQDCGTNKISYDLCSDCLASYVLHESGASHTNTPPIYFPPQHTVYHHFCPIQKQPQQLAIDQNASSWDPDYLASSSSYNYLDPNFMPD